MPVDQTRIAILQNDMEVALQRQDWRAHVEAEVALENLYKSEGAEQYAMGNFDTSAAVQLIVANLNDKLQTTLSSFPTPPVDERAELEEILVRTRQLAVSARAQSAMLSGLYYLNLRLADKASEDFRSAQSLYRTLQQADADPQETDLWRVLHDYVGALAHMATGIRESLRLNYHGAASAFQRATTGMKAILEERPKPGGGEDTGELATFLAWIERELVGCNISYLTASYYEERTRGDYQAAVGYSEEFCQLSQALLDEAPSDPPWYRPLIENQLHLRLADLEFAKGQLSMQQEQWDEALASFERAGSQFQKAAESMLRTQLPQSVAGQETALNQASAMEIWRRQCKGERLRSQRAKRVEQDLEWFKSAVADTLAKSGGEVNIYSQAVATVEANMRQETSLREAAQELLEALPSTRLDLGTQREIAGLVEQLVDAPERGPHFIDKAKAVTGKVADIVRNMSEIAGPLIPIIQKLAGLAGLPIPS